MKIPWLAIIAAFVVGGIIHIAAVLGMPHVAPNDAWDRLALLSKPNTLLVLPAATAAHQTLPLMAPDMRYAVCLYDASEGPVRLRTQILDDLWVIAFYTPLGENYYTISGGDLKRERVEMVISTQAETLMQLEVDATEDAENIVIVKAPQAKGIAMIRVPLRGPAYAARAELALQQASCASRALAPSVLTPGPTSPSELPLPTPAPEPPRD